MPGEPLLAFTRFSAARQFRRRPPAPSGDTALHAYPSARFPVPPLRLPRARRPSRLHRCLRSRARCDPASVAWPLREPRSSRSSLRSVLRRVAPTTTTSADFSLPTNSASPFQAQSEISPGKNANLPCAIAGSTSLRLGHDGFAVMCPLALLEDASYPVPVRRPAGSLHASFTPSSQSDALHFTSLAVTSSREDFHLQVNAHAGRTKKSGRRWNDGRFSPMQTSGLRPGSCRPGASRQRRDRSRPRA